MIFINTESVASSRNEAALVTLDAGRFAIPALGPSSGRLLRQPAMPPPLNRVWLQSYVCHAHVGVFLLIMVQLVMEAAGPPERELKSDSFAGVLFTQEVQASASSSWAATSATAVTATPAATTVAATGGSGSGSESDDSNSSGSGRNSHSHWRQGPTTFMAMAMPDPPKATTRSRTPMSKTSASNASLGSPRTSAQGASPYSTPSCSANSSCTPSDTDSSAARPSSTSSSLGEGAPPKLGSSCCSCSPCGAICKSS